MFHYLVVNQGFISVALIVFGAFVAGARDLSFDARGYAIVFVANITTAVYLATINRIGKAVAFSNLYCHFTLDNLSDQMFFFVFLGKSSGLNSFGLMWCNGIILVAINFRSNFICFKVLYPVCLYFRTCLWTFSTVLDIYPG
jgi:hypothetical protein